MNYPDLATKASKYFTWHEILWLPKWSRAATEEDGLSQAILDTLQGGAQRMDTVREYFDAPLLIHCWYRPPAYNREVHGALSSAHMCLNGNWAVDFHVEGYPPGESIKRILADSKLSEWGLRMENNGESPGWIHLDSARVVRGRYFKP